MTKYLIILAFVLAGCQTHDVEESNEKMFCREDGRAFIGKGGLGGNTYLLRLSQLDQICQQKAKP